MFPFLLGGPAVAGGARLAAGRSCATILEEVADQGVHGLEVSRVDQRSSPAFLPHDSRLGQVGEMEGQSRIGDAEVRRDLARGESFVSCLNKQAKEP